MSVQIKLLDLDTERELFIQAYLWRRTAPKWFRACLRIWKESLKQYLANARNELHYGVWQDEQFIAVVRLISAGTGILNIHLSAKKGVKWGTLLAAGEVIREHVFCNGIRSAYGYLPSINRGISRLYEALGFIDTGIRIYKGIVHNKVVEWKHYAIANPGAAE